MDRALYWSLLIIALALVILFIPLSLKVCSFPFAEEQWIVHTTRTLRERLLMPCIAFTFSRTECEHYAAAIREMDMTDGTVGQD